MRAFAILAMLVAAMASGCTARNVYDGLRLQQESECQKMQGSDRDACMRRSGMTYDEYQRQLKEQDRKK